MSYRVRDVFVAGGQPKITYNPREDHKLEEQIKEYLETGYKVLSVSGPTKSGKTVLVRRLVPSENSIWIYGGQISTIEGFWENILQQLNGFNETSITETSLEGSNKGGGASVGANILGAGINVNVSGSKVASDSLAVNSKRQIGPEVAGINSLKDSNKILVIDDFHYIENSIQEKIIRSLKSLVFDGNIVILISVPHRMNDAVRVEREMTGRVKQVSVPLWSREELEQIARVGFESLNLITENSVVEKLAKESYGSPHLMQDFCGQLCRDNNISEGPSLKQAINIKNRWVDFFRKKANEASKAAFDRLAGGPRQRTDRMQRKLKNGESCDIYKLVLVGIATTGPKLEIQYEDLRNAFREIIENLPERHEVTRVLEKMTDIAKNEIVGEPVVEWDKHMSRLYISDPFFAYFLRWSDQLDFARKPPSILEI